MKPVVLFALLALAGCDQLFGISPVTGAGPDANSTDDAGGMTVTFGETGTTTYGQTTYDTYLDAANPTLSYGGAPRIIIDGGSTPVVGLIRFDLRQFTADVTVTGASLRLTTRTDGSNDAIGVYKLNEQWDEGSGSGAPGVANWTERTPSFGWSVAGAAPPSRSSMPLATFTPINPQTAYEVPLPPDVVMQWLATPDTNDGVAIVAPSFDGASFTASDSSEVPDRPVLTIHCEPR